MWIMLNDSFISIVDKGDPTGQTLLVRARKAGDIERVFPEAAVQTGGGTDYKFRARIDREHVAKKIAESVRNIRYSNFKNTVHEDDRHDAYLSVWRSMYVFQRENKP